MMNRKKLNIRIDSELDALLRSRAKKGLTAFVEALIVKGLITDMNELYESAISAANEEGGIYRKTLEEQKILALEKRLEATEKELEYQQKLLINICVSDGMTTEKVNKLAQDIVDKKDYKGRLRFHNRLIADIARTKNHTMEEITKWMSS